MGIFRQFPYSNFHDMNMDEIIKIVRQLADDWVAYQIRWGNLYNDIQDALQDFKDYVDTYFENLNVQTEINNKINAMVADGTFNAIVRTQLSPVVRDWLEANITEPEGVVIDASLSIAGACADAKATGDAIAQVKDDIEEVLGENPYVTLINNWVDGYYIQSNSSPVDINDPQQLAAYRYAVVNCSPGEKFTITGRGGVGPRLWAFIDDSGNLRTASGGDVTAENLVITAPSLAAKLVLNDRDKTGKCYRGVYQNINERIEYLENNKIVANDYTGQMNNGYIETAMPAGTVINVSNITPSSTYKNCVIPVKKGDTILITGKGAIGARLWAFIDTANKINSTSLISAEANNMALTANIDGKCIINVLTANPYKIIHITNSGVVKEAMLSISDQLRYYMYHNHNIKYANAFKPVKLSNYTNDPQNVHPKVLYFPDGVFDHKYWMAYTPYPNGHSEYENPSIAYSDDGYSWTNYAHNPLAYRVNNDTVNYNSDTHLVYHNDMLECWWRFVNETNNVEILYRRLSTDGIHWNPTEEVLRHSSIATLLSPAIFFEDNKYKMWVVNAQNDPHIEYWEADPLAANWTKIRDIDLTYEYDGVSYMPWHIDVIHHNNQYIMVIMCKDNITTAHNTKWSLFVATSSDNITYSTPECIITGNEDSWDAMIYRACIVPVKDIYRIYYSARSSAGKYDFGITESPTVGKFVGLNTETY